jgi:tRNA pseudouridine55 synthase
MRSAPTEGLLLVDKPAGVTSHDVVALARRAYRERRVGHLGTLDPFATGLLVLLVGSVTRLARFVDAEPKVYEATIRFGEETDTDDSTGAVVRSATPPARAALDAAMRRLTGRIEQLPPAYSAKKVGGRRAYVAARRGEPLELRPASVTVWSWDVRAERVADGRVVELDVTIRCSGGTYIRALARDLGRAVGSAAHLTTLRRTRAGAFDVRDAHAAAALHSGAPPLRPALDALPSLARERLDGAGLRQASHGSTVPATVPGALAALLSPDGGVAAIAERDGECWRPVVVLAAPSAERP